MPWSFVGTISTSLGLVYAKSVSSAAAFEAELTAVLSDISSDVVDVIAYSREDGWLVTKGFSEAGDRPDFTILKQAVIKFAKLQIKSIDNKEHIITTGIPVINPGRIDSRYSQVIERFSALPESHPSHINDSEKVLLESLADRVVISEQVLHSSAIPSAIEHGDLLPKNLLLVPGARAELKWFDFGDASWNFPFMSLDMLVDARFSFLQSSQISEVVDAYLGVWGSFYPDEDLRMLFDESIIQATVRRAEVRLDIMEQVSVDALGDLASFGKDEFLLLGDKIKKSIY
jgi:hypothetical protein